MKEYLRVCKMCNNRFFTIGEKTFYETKGLSLPNYCSDCREKIKLKKALQTISSEWKLEAKQEDIKYFYSVKEVNALLNGTKYYIIGRKGSGKTAIAKHLYEISEPKVFTEKLSFKNFPFNYLYSLENKNYTAPNQYITIWKYVIYSCICRMMLRNQNIDMEAKDALSKLYDTNPIKSLDRLIDKWTKKEFGAQILGNGIIFSGEKTAPDELPWIEKVNILEDFINCYIDDSKYLILFDELDEDYRDFSNDEEKNTYIYLLTSLFKAVQGIRGNFLPDNKRIYPVIFLRNDIYRLIRDSDKNKWSDFLIDLEWTIPELKSMLAFRLNKVLDMYKPLAFGSIWNKFFPNPYVQMGFQGKKRMEVFAYVTRSTQLRPRDYIHYIQECATLALSKGQNSISAQTVKEVDDNFSEYLKDEIVDEISAIIPEIHDILSILSQIRKQTFSPSEFVVVYDELVKKKQIPDIGAENVLIMLFDFSIIGNKPSMKGQAIFKYQNKNARFNFHENIMIHRGLFKALQIF